MQLKIKEKCNISGKLTIRTGLASEIISDENNNIRSWKFTQKKQETIENVVCYPGLQFSMSNGWNSLAIAIVIGNGSVTGGSTPANTDVQLENELSNGRFLCPSGQRVYLNTVHVAALWPAGHPYTSEVTEWGLFAQKGGQNVVTQNSGFMVCRTAYSFSRSAGFDAELNWAITFN